MFFDNVNSGESIFDFTAAQQDYNKKLLQIEFSYSDDCDSYDPDFFMSFKTASDDKYDRDTEADIEENELFLDTITNL